MRRYKPIFKESNAISTFSPGTQISVVSGKDLAVLDAKIAYDMYAATYSNKSMSSDPQEVEINQAGSPDQYIQNGSITVAKNDLIKADKTKVKSKDWFEKRYPLWTFFGNAQGYVAVRKQASGAVRINLIAGDKVIVLKAFIELLKKGWPLWTTVDDQVATMLMNPKIGFTGLSSKALMMLFDSKYFPQSPLIPSNVMGVTQITVNNDNSITIDDDELGALKKYFMVNSEWLSHTLKLGKQQGWPQEILNELGGNQGYLPQQQLSIGN